MATTTATPTITGMPRILGPAEQVVAHYQREITDGRLRPGDELPSNRDMVKQWRISTATALRAVADLRDGGWIEVRPGKPPVVKDRTR